MTILEGTKSRSENCFKFKLTEFDNFKPAPTSEALKFKHPRVARLENAALNSMKMNAMLESDYTIIIDGKKMSKSAKFVRDVHKLVSKFE